MSELRRLRLLHELALRGTPAAVAEALSYSPSTISQQLARRGKDVGVPLLVACSPPARCSRRAGPSASRPGIPGRAGGAARRLPAGAPGGVGR